MLEKYIKRFASLRTATTPKYWTAITQHKAPHKPLLLLAILDLFAQGIIKTNLIEFHTELVETFASYWSKVMPSERRGNIAYPFFHLKSEKFWHLVPKPEKTSILAKKTSISSVIELDSMIIGAQLDEELYALFLDKSSRETLRKVLIETYFAPEVQSSLFEQGKINVEAFQYSLDLIEQRKPPRVEEAIEYKEMYPTPVRDQGFRLAIVKVYQHRCTICGIRTLTPEGHTVVDAAHIIPWSISHNDDPRNGVALCKLCHWMFDEGLITISSQYVVIISPQLSANENIPGHLVTLNGRGIIEPIKNVFLPDVESLKWHYHEVFRSRKKATLL